MNPIPTWIHSIEVRGIKYEISFLHSGSSARLYPMGKEDRMIFSLAPPKSDEFKNDIINVLKERCNPDYILKDIKVTICKSWVDVH